ncbi:MAG: type II secretion system F family protein [Methylococcaceae bacterium]|nr:type II secretion system F family protein [Methylococcaceae bacterium]
MPQFHIKARNSAGELVDNFIDADNPMLAAQIISNRGMIPISITPKEQTLNFSENFNHWLALNQLNLTDLMLFCRQMYSMTKAGVPITRALRSLIESTRNRALVDALKDIAKRLESGSALAPAMNNHKKIFTPLMINIINVGESSGGLDLAFLQLSNYLGREKETETRIKSALRYPMMVIVAITIAMVIVNIYVIPAFRGVFDKMHAELPWQTKLLMSISEFMVSYWPYLLLAVVILMTALIRYINTSAGRLRWDKLILSLPAVGSIIERSTMERFSRSFAMILNAGVPLIQGIAIVSAAIGNTYVGSRLDQLRIGIEKGDTISRMARSTQLFPPLVIQMIMVGEETGNISDMLLEVANFYETEIDAELKNLASVIEPILIIIIGIMVLVLALGIFLPMWNLSSTMLH